MVAGENLSLKIILENTTQLIRQIDSIKSSIISVSKSAPSGKVFDAIKKSAIETRVILDQFGKVLLTVPVNKAPLTGLEASARKAARAVKGTGVAAKKAGKDVRQGTQQISRMARVLNRAAGAAKIAAGAFLGLSAFNIAQQAVAALTRQLQLAKKLFIETQAAVLRFSAGLQATGTFSERAVKDIQQYASAVQSLTGISDDAVIHAAALIAQLGGLSGPVLTRATDAAIELSKVLGIDLKTAALLLAKAAQGNTTQFQRYGIVIDRLIPAHKRFSALLEKIETQFSGTAEVAARGLGGSLNKLSKTWDDLLKVAGSTLQILQPQIDSVTESLTKWVAQQDNQIDNTVLASDTIEEMIKVMKSLQEVQDKLSSGDVLLDLGNALAKLFLGLDNAESVSKKVSTLTKALKVLELQANTFQFKAGDEEGLNEFIENIERAIIRLNRLRKDISSDLAVAEREFLSTVDIDKPVKIPVEIVNGKRAIKELDDIAKGLSSLKARALEVKPIRVEALLQREFDKLRDIQTGLVPPLEMELIAASAGEFVSDMARVESAMKSARDRAERPLILRIQPVDPHSAEGFTARFGHGIESTSKEFEEMRKRFAETAFTIGDFELDPRHVAQFEKTKLSLEANVLLDPEKPQTTKFEKEFEGIYKRLQDARARAFDPETGAVIDPKAAAEVKLWVQLLELAITKAGEFNRALEFKNFKPLGPILPDTDTIAQTTAELKSLRDILKTYLETRGADSADIADVMGLEDIKKVSRLIEVEIERSHKRIQEIQAQIGTPEGRDAALRAAEDNLAILQDLERRIAAIESKFQVAGKTFSESIGRIGEAARAQLPPLDKVANASTEAAERSREAFDSMMFAISGSLEAVLDAMIVNTENFADSMRQIFRQLVADAFKIFAKLLVIDIIKQFATGGVVTPFTDPTGFITKAGQGEPAPGTEPLPKAQVIPFPVPDVQAPDIKPPVVQFTAPAIKPPIVRFTVPDIKPSVVQFPVPDQLTPVVEFRRLLRAQGVQRPQQVVVKLDERRDVRPEPRRPDVTIFAMDGASVRRQYTHGALRAESARSARRKSL